MTGAPIASTVPDRRDAEYQVVIVDLVIGMSAPAVVKIAPRPRTRVITSG